MTTRFAGISRLIAPLSGLAVAALFATLVPTLTAARSWDADRDAFGWSVIESRHHTTCGSTDRHDWIEIQDLADEESLPVLWFRLDGKSYVVREDAVVAQAREMVEPMRVLGEKQSKLGERQSALGERQSELGGRQSKLGGRQAALSAKLTRAAYASARDGEDRDARHERDRLQDEIETLSDEQRELGQRQSVLGAEQSKLGRQQAALGREQAQISREIEPKMRRLAEQAVRDGIAKRYSR